MGSGCSSSAGKAAEPQQGTECPPRPAYLACDLVGPPVLEKVRIGPVDTLLGQAHHFAEAVCQLNDSLNGLLLDVRLATGLLQGGFSLLLSPSPNVDIFSFELLTAEGRPLEMAEAARLRGRDVTRGGRLAALDAQLAQCLEGLADSFVRNVGCTNSSLSLSPSGTLVPRAAGQPPDPVVEAFNRTMLNMRATLGADYLLALHLHKAQAHGVPAFRVRLLKPSPEVQPWAPASGTEAPAPPAPSRAPAAAPASSSSAAAGFASLYGPSPLAPSSSPPGFEPATLLDQAGCMNASRLADALHGFQDANGRLAAALNKTGLTCNHAVVQVTPRSVALAGSSASTTASTAPSTTSTASTFSPAGTHSRHHQHHHHQRHHSSPKPRVASSSSSSYLYSSSSPASKPSDPAAAAAAAVRALPPPSRLLVARAVEALNAAVHSLGHAAAAAPGPASFAALVTHVLGELRDVVAAAGGDRALEAYQPQVHFTGGPDAAPSLDFRLDPQLPQPQSQPEGALSVGAGAGGQPVGAGRWARPPPAFPDCLSPPVRRAWLLLGELVRLHNSAVAQLGPLRQLAAAFEERLRLRSDSLPQDAVAARMPPSEASEAGRKLLRNHAELRGCWQGALQALTSTALLVRDEMAEAAQLARVQCSFMSPVAWSMSIASSSAATTSPGGGATGSLSSTALSSSTTLTATTNGGATPRTSVGALGGTTAAAAAAPAADGGSPGRSPLGSRQLAGGAGGVNVRSFAAKNLASSFAAAAEEISAVPLLGSPQDVFSLQDQQQQRKQQEQQQQQLLQQQRPPAAAAAAGTWPSLSPPGATAAASGNGGGGGGGSSPLRAASRTYSRTTGGGSRSTQRTNSTLSRRPGSQGSGAGWVPLDGGLGDGGAVSTATADGPMGRSPSPTRPPRPAAAQSPAGTSSSSPAAAAAAAAARGRAGGESLADEYARTALAHLRLQDL